MIRCIITIIIFFCVTGLYAQSDFIQLKKKNTVIDNWFKGNYITLQLKNGQWLDAVIYTIKNDSLYIRPYALQTNYNRLGINYIDTIFYGFLAVSPNSIHAFPKKNEGSGLVKRGTLLKVGGGGFLLLNIINTLGKNEPVFGNKNLPKLGIASGVLAAGIILGLIHKSTYIIGKKYHIEYISTKTSS